MLRADDPMVLNEQQQKEEQTCKKEVSQKDSACKEDQDAVENMSGAKPPCGKAAEDVSTLDPWTLVTLAGDAFKGKKYTDAVDFFSQALEIL